LCAKDRKRSRAAATDLFTQYFYCVGYDSGPAAVEDVD